MTPGNVPECDGINQFGHRLAQGGKHRLQPRVEEQRFLVAHEEMIELHVKVRHVNREPEEVGGDFVNSGHGSEASGSERIGKTV